MGLEANATDDTLERLGRFIAAAACAQLPQHVVQKAKACLLYGLATGIASVRAPQPRQAALAIDREASGSAGGATRLMDGRELDFPAAAFCNSVLFHSRVQDDAHPCGHFGVVVIPAALACAQRFDATGADALAAIVAGYEIALRIGRDHAADLSERGFRTTPAYGPFAAAACGARLMKLDAYACANALSLAANTAAGLREWSDAGTEEGPFQVGVAARNGLLAANMAAAGAIGASSALTGRAGFFRAYATDSQRYAQRVCDGLGEEFEFENVTCKPYPICQFLTGVVRGMIELRARARNRSPRTIAIHMHPFEADFVGIRFSGPFSSFPQTLMSAPFCAALGWVRQAVTFDGMHDFNDEGVLAVVRKIAVVSDSSRARYSPRLAVTLDDSTVLEWEETEGANADRLTWDTAMKMNVELCAEVGVPKGKAQALICAVADIDKATNVRKVLAAAVAAAHLALAPASHAQPAWKPEKPVEIVVPAAAGGGTDRTARTIQKIFQDRRLVETPAVVVNKPGAQGGIGFLYGSQHRGDAHYLVTTYPSLLTNHIIGTSPINHTHFTPLAQFGNEYVGFAVKADSQLRSTKDLLDRLRKDPGSVVFATFALGAPTHIAVALVSKAAGVDVRKLKVVVVASGGEALTALLGGHVDMVPSSVANLAAPMQDGRIRIVAVAAPKRLPGVFAQVPTWKENGIDAVTGYWRGVVGPPALSPAQIAFWDDVFARLVKTDEWKKELDRTATENEYINSRESKQFLDGQYEELRRALADLGLAKQN